MKVYNKSVLRMFHPDLYESLHYLRLRRDFNASRYIQKKSQLLNRYMRKYKLSSCVIGISGGIDSAVTLGIIHKASKMKNSPIKRIIPLLLPIFYPQATSNQESSLKRGIEVVRFFLHDPIVIDLTQNFVQLDETITRALRVKSRRWAMGQLVSYIRTPVMYYVTSLFTQLGSPGIVCGTTNRDEGAYLGYYGKASDGMVDMQLISDIHKSEVNTVAGELKIPENIRSAIPTGDMFDNRTDEEVFGVSYDFVELFLLYKSLKTKDRQQEIEKKWSPTARKQFLLVKRRLEKLHTYNAHKYLVGSPSVHLDVHEREIPGGWTHNYSFTV